MAPNKSRRRALAALGAWVAAGSPALALAQRGRPDLPYVDIPPVAGPAGSAIEVVEFFWYGCPFCFQLQAPLEAWLARKPADVQFRRVPALFRPSWVPHGRLYFTLEALGVAERLHPAVFRAYHVERRSLNDADGIAEWAVQQGIDRERWLAAYSAPDMEDKLRGSLRQLQDYQVNGTPSLAVAGRYLTSSSMTPTVPGLIPVLDELIALARSARTTR